MIGQSYDDRMHGNTKHGHWSGKNGKAGTRTYRAWSQMKERCKPTYGQAKDYHDRGIMVCDRWQVFENFLEDMGEMPEGRSLDRIDNDKGYEPGNCRWATREEQNRNKSTNRMMTLDGVTMTMVEWAEKLGMNYRTLNTRVQRGWSDKRALTTPVSKE